MLPDLRLHDDVIGARVVIRDFEQLPSRGLHIVEQRIVAAYMDPTGHPRFLLVPCGGGRISSISAINSHIEFVAANW